MEILPTIDEDQTMCEQYDMLTFLPEKQRHFVRPSKYSKNEIFNNMVLIEKLIFAALKVDS